MTTEPNFDHDHPGDSAEGHEYTTHTYGADISVSKVGGGTVGKAYEGHWHYVVKVGDHVVTRGSNFQTSCKCEHHNVALIIGDIVASEPK